MSPLYLVLVVILVLALFGGLSGGTMRLGGTATVWGTGASAALNSFSSSSSFSF